MSKNRAIVFLFAAVLAWSSIGALIKSVHTSILTLCCLSSGISAVVQFGFVRRVRWSKEPTIIVGIGLYLLISVTVVAAVKMTTAANAMLLQFCSPVFAGIFGVLFLNEPPKREEKIAVPLVLLGILLFFADQLEFGHFIGNCLGLLSGVFVAGYTIALRYEKSRSQTEIVMLSNIVVFFAFLPWAATERISTGDLLPILFAGVLSAFGWMFYGRAVQVVSPMTALIVTTPEAVLSPLIVALAIGEIPGFLAVAGGVIVLAAVGWYTSSCLGAAAMPE